MAYDQHSNFGYGTISSAPSPGTSGTTLVLGTSTFAQFPDPSGATPYNVVVWPSGTIPLASNAEVIRVVTKGTNGTIEVERAQESSTNRDIGVGDQAALAVTAKSFTDMESATNKTFTWVVDTPAVGGIPGPKLDKAYTVASIDSYVTAATSVTFNIEERTTIGSAGSNLATADLVSVTTGTTLTSFADSALGSASWLWLDISAVSGLPGKVVVSLKVTN